MQHVYLWNNGAGGTQWTLEYMFGLNTRFQVLCQTQDEFDLLKGYSLMFGRELELDTWEHWQLQRAVRKSLGSSLRLLPIVFTTWPDAKLRGL